MRTFHGCDEFTCGCACKPYPEPCPDVDDVKFSALLDQKVRAGVPVRTAWAEAQKEATRP